MQDKLHRKLGFALFMSVAALCGCESPAWVRTLNESFSGQQASREIEEHRKTYVSTRDRRAMRWLLTNCVESGMTREEVSKVMGEEGEPEPNDRWLKTGGGNYRMDDSVFRFGPDNEGHSVYLVFRDDHLYNFEPSQFRGGSR